MGDLYALLTAVCWSIAVILFDLSSNKFNALQINIVKEFSWRYRLYNHHFYLEHSIPEFF